MSSWKNLAKPTVFFWILASILILETTRRTEFWAGVKDQTLPFYTALQPGWLTLSKDEVQQTLELGDGGDWNILTARTMMNRWRLRSISEKPWNALMDDYDNGLWISASREELEALLAEADANWLRRRKEALDQQATVEEIPFTPTERSANGIRIVLDSPTPTHTIGSVLSVEFEADTPITTGAPALYWQTNKSGRTALRRMLTVQPVLTSPAGVAPLTYRADYDFSWHPDWLASGIELTALDLAFPEEQTNRVLRLSGTDSALLPVP